MSSSEKSEVIRKKKTKSGRRGLFVSGFLVLLAGLIFFLPSILIYTPLKDVAVGYASNQIKGSVEVGAVSASWLRPVRMNDINIKDQSGKDVATISALSTSQTLFGLLVGNEIGKITVHQPAVQIEFTDTGSNWEDVFESYLNSDEPTAESSLPRMEIEVIDGVVQLDSEYLRQAGIFHGINSQIQLGGPESAVVADGEFLCDDGNGQTGRLTLQISLGDFSDGTGLPDLDISIDAHELPIQPMAPALTRVFGPINCAGQLNAQVSAEIDNGGNEVIAKFESGHVSDFALVAPDWLGADQLSIQNLILQGEILLDQQKLRAQELIGKSDFGRFGLDGSIEFDELVNIVQSSQLPASEFNLDGSVDLAKLTSALPSVFRIRENVAIRSGLLDVSASSRAESGRNKLLVNAETAKMELLVDGQVVNWHRPLRLIGVASQGDFLELEEFHLESDFLTAAGSGTIDSGQIRLNGDLRSLLDQIAQVVDTTGIRIDGECDGAITWQRQSNENGVDRKDVAVEITGGCKIKKPHLAINHAVLYSEPELDVSLKTVARLAGYQRVGIDSGSFKFQSGQELAILELLKPIGDLRDSGPKQIQCQLSGSLGKWTQQMRQLATLPEFECDGNITSQFICTINQELVRLNQWRWTAEPLRFNGFGLNINEPKVNGRANIRYRWDDGSLELTKSRIASASVAGQTERIELQTSPNLTAEGLIQLKGNANLASQWLGFSMPGDSVRWDGDISGSINFSDQQRLGGELNLMAKDLVFVMADTDGPRYTNQSGGENDYLPVWQETSANLQAVFQLAADFDSMSIAESKLDCETAKVQAAGTVSDFANNMNVDLKGNWLVNWQKINQAIQASVGDAALFQGARWQPFQIKGPLYDQQPYAWLPHQLAAALNLSWDQAKFFDVPLTGTLVNVRFDSSQLNLETQGDSNLIDKVLQLKPNIDLRNADPVLRIPEGKILDRWPITVDDSRSWLKYVAPVIADATSAEGEVSASIGSATTPLFDPFKTSASGMVELHQLSVGPGPLARQLIPLIDQLLAIAKLESTNLQSQSTWFRLPQQRIPVAVQNGRVFHQHFEVQYKNVTIKTRGSVGFDQTIDLIADVPIQAAWVGDNRILQKLIGRTLSIPIGGTLSQPKLDRRSMTQFTQQLAQQAATEFVNEKVGSEVNKLRESVDGRVQNELNRFQEKVNSKFKNEIEDKLQNQLRGGLDRLFGGDKK